MKIIKVEYWLDIPKNFTGIAIDGSGSKFWYKNGKSHREDGPADEWSTIVASWYLDGNKYTEEEHKKEMALRNSTLGKLLKKRTQL